MIKLQDVSFRYGKKTVFSDFSYTFADAKTTAVTGSSGAGKTTLLRLLAGLEKPTAGKIFVPAPVATLFQEPRLCPWLTALKNVSFVLRNEKEKAKIYLEKVGLKEETDAYPHELSGGMQQRVALARMLAYAEECPLALLDEPFKGLDKELRKNISDLTFSLLRGKTVVLVTHDEQDLTYADEVLDLSMQK